MFVLIHLIFPLFFHLFQVSVIAFSFSLATKWMNQERVKDHQVTASWERKKEEEEQEEYVRKKKEPSCCMEKD